MRPPEFDAAFDAEIAKGAVHIWAMTKAGTEHCNFLGVDPARLQRVTGYPFGATKKVSPAQEIVAFRTREDADRPWRSPNW
jgi:hypothetical protein